MPTRPRVSGPPDGVTGLMRAALFARADAEHRRSARLLAPLMVRRRAPVTDHHALGHPAWLAGARC
ncbi:MAG: hypothetical protein MUE51_01440 [Thermoleophilia bacterium]|jgi:hypothetical protein|nr:hypothetical protein [Thermoleophilia bacterium]